MKRTIFWVLLVVLCWTLPALASSQFTPHARFLRQHQFDPPAFETRTPTVPRAAVDEKHPYEVMAFYPYWTSQPVASINYGFLKTIAFFSLEVDQYGDLTNLHGWPHGELVDQAHAHGDRVVVTVTNFSSSQQATLLASATYRDNAVDNIVAQVVAGDADGVNIDFEGLPYSAKANFVTFIAELADALDDVLTDPHLTVCTPAIDWNGCFDYDQLAANADYLMIMAYDYHYSGGDPGPVAPLYAGGIWPSWAGIDYTLDDYETYIVPYDLSKVILGLPLYGYNWPTVDAGVPGEATGSGSAVILATAMDMANSGSYGPRLWDESSRTDYLTYQAGDGWRQLWWGGYIFFRQRFVYGIQRGCGGAGFWALGYLDEDVAAEAFTDALSETDDLPTADFAADDADDDYAGCGGF